MRYFQYSSSLWTFHVLKTSKIIVISSITVIICKWLTISCLVVCAISWLATVWRVLTVMYHFIPRHIGGFDDQFGSVSFILNSLLLVSKLIPKIKSIFSKLILKPTNRYVFDQRPNTLYLLTYFKYVHLRKNFALHPRHNPLKSTRS